jgi:hypothetical protein
VRRNPQSVRREPPDLVAKTELLFAELHAPAETLRDAIALLVELAGELEADAAETRSALAVNADA